MSSSVNPRQQLIAEIPRQPAACGHRLSSWLSSSLMLIIPLLLVTPLQAATLSAPPNVIFILLDDADIADVGVYGSPDVMTPNIDTVAAEGMRFDRYYSAAPVCSPARAALLTGHAPARYGIERAILDTSFRGLPASTPALPQMLGQLGYRSAHIGKWHVGSRKAQFLPRAKGFDHSVRLLTDSGLSYQDYRLSINDEQIEHHKDDQHLTRTLTDHALSFLDDAFRNHPEQPVYLNLWYLAPHKPLYQLPEQFDNAHTAYCLDSSGAHGDCDENRGNFAALMTTVDHQIGRILEFLSEHEQRGENTMVVIASDNGGESLTHGPWTLPERTLRSYKGRVFDGGIRVPFIIRWPGVASAGVVNNSLISGVDWVPTLLDLLGAEHLYSGSGESFAGVFAQNAHLARDGMLFFQNKAANRAFTNQSGIFSTYAATDGRWKLVFTPARDVDDVDRRYLFNLRDDPSERVSLLNTPAPRAFGIRQNLTLWFDSLFTDAGPSETAVSRTIADHLQGRYLNWRRHTGNISYRLTQNGASIAPGSSPIPHEDGVMTLEADERLDFDDGDFSFSATIQPESLQGKTILAAKQNSWQLHTDGQQISLTLFGDNEDGDPVSYQLSGPETVPGVEYHVAFTVFGWRDDPSTVTLYVDGRSVGRTPTDNPIHSWRGMDGQTPSVLTIGSGADGELPFSGEISRLRISAMSLFPTEIALEANRLTESGSRP